LIGIKPEVIQRAVANRIGVLVLGKRLAVPGDGAAILGNSPRRVAITLVSLRAIMRKPGMLRRRMKLDLADGRSAYRHTERLNGAVQVLVIDRVFIVPDSSSWVCHLVTHEPYTIDSRGGLDPLAHCRASPRLYRRLLSHCRSRGAKGEICRPATHIVPLVGSIIVHVALGRMILAPGVFVRDNVFRFGKIRGA
jgi:hypothetical protein